LIESGLAIKLIPLCVNGAPSTAFLNYTLLTLYHLSDNAEYCEILKKNSILGFLTSDWYKDFGLTDQTVQNGCAIVGNILAKSKIQLLLNQEEDIRALVAYLKEHRNGILNVLQYIERGLKRNASLPSDNSGKNNNNNAQQNKNQNKNNQKQNKPVNKQPDAMQKKSNG